MNAFVVRLAAIVSLAGGSELLAQGVRSASTAVAGGSMQVDVATNDDTVEVSAAGSGNVTSHPVPPGRRVTIPVPPVPPGTILFVSVGRGLRARVIQGEVTAP